MGTPDLLVLAIGIYACISGMYQWHVPLLHTLSLRRLWILLLGGRACDASWVAVGTPDLLVLTLSEFMHASVACISGMYPSYTRLRYDDYGIKISYMYI